MVTALIGAAILAGLLALTCVPLATLTAEKKSAAFIAGLGACTGMFVLNLILFYASMPTFGATFATYWQGGAFWMFFVEAIAVLGITYYFGDDKYNDLTWSPGTAIVATLLVVALVPQLFAGIWTDARAKSLADELKVTAAVQNNPKTPLKSYEATDAKHLILLSPDQAFEKAKGAIGEMKDVEIGSFKGNASTIFEVVDGGLRSIDGRGYYVFPLKVKGRQNTIKVGGSIPGYIRVDAEDPKQPAVPVMTDKNGQKLDIKYSPYGKWSHDINRLIWTKFHANLRGTPMLDIDDDGKPWFVCTLNRLTLNRQASVPDSVVLINAQTGEAFPVKLDEVPDWVDVIVDPAIAEMMINRWGNWSQAHHKLAKLWGSDANRYKIPEGESPVQVYTKDGHPSYQAILTSYNSDNAASYLMMMNGRSGTAITFEIKNLTMEATAASAIIGSKANAGTKWTPTHLVLHMINGYLTWVTPMEMSDGKHIFQAVAMINATDRNGTTVAIGPTTEKALEIYAQNMANDGGNTGANEGGNDKPTEGTVLWVSKVVEPTAAGSTTVVYIVLKNDPSRLYRIVPNNAMREARFVESGHRVVMSFRETGSTEYVNVHAFDLLDPNLRLVS